MAETAAPAASRITDPDLAEWARKDSDETREIIIQAKLPARRVSASSDLRGRHRLTGFETAGSSSRRALLQELGSELAALTGEEPTMLRAAGAVALRATGRQVHQLLDHPLIRRISSNRQLPAR